MWCIYRKVCVCTLELEAWPIALRFAGAAPRTALGGRLGRKSGGLKEGLGRVAGPGQGVLSSVDVHRAHMTAPKPPAP